MEHSLTEYTLPAADLNTPEDGERGLSKGQSYFALSLHVSRSASLPIIIIMRHVTAGYKSFVDHLQRQQLSTWKFFMLARAAIFIIKTSVMISKQLDKFDAQKFWCEIFTNHTVLVVYCTCTSCLMLSLSK